MGESITHHPMRKLVESSVATTTTSLSSFLDHSVVERVVLLTRILNVQVRSSTILLVTAFPGWPTTLNEANLSFHASHFRYGRARAVSTRISFVSILGLY